MPVFKSGKHNKKLQKYCFDTWNKWCVLNSIQALPGSDINVALYLINLSESAKSSSRITEAFYAISWAHRLAGVPDPSKSDLVITVKERALRILGHLITKKEPITPDILKNIVLLYGNDRSNLKDVRVACLCLLCFSGFLRFSELSNLRRNDISFFILM